MNDCDCKGCNVTIDVPESDLVGSSKIIPLSCEVTGELHVYPVPERFRSEGFSQNIDAHGHYVLGYESPENLAREKLALGL